MRRRMKNNREFHEILSDNGEEIEIIQKKKSCLCAGTKRRIYFLCVLSMISLGWVFVYYKLLHHKFDLPEPLQQLRKMFGDGKVKKRRGRLDETENVQAFDFDNVTDCLPQFQRPRSSEYIHVVIVACGKDNVKESLIALKTILLTTNFYIYFHIFTDDPNAFERGFEVWPAWKDKWMMYITYRIMYPNYINKRVWHNVFKPCATQRLFLAHTLSNIDSVIYIDTDVLILEPIEYLWKYFMKLDKDQFAAMVPECEPNSTCWYGNKTRHPFFHPNGLNSGVMLMNLTRMRSHEWERKLFDIFNVYKNKISWGDQDLLNIFFAIHPQFVYNLPCSWNYRAEHCLEGNKCETANIKGISALHGSRMTFKKVHLLPEFYYIFNIFNRFNIKNGDFQKDITQSIIKELSAKKYKMNICAHFLRNATVKHLKCPNS